MKKLRSECMSCIIKKYLDNFPEDADEDMKSRFLRKAFESIANAPETSNGPLLARDLDRLKDDMLGAGDFYTGIKKHFNKLMMGYEPMIRDRIRRADDPLRLAVQYAMAGNYIDFGALDRVDEDVLRERLETADEIEINEDTYRDLKKDLESCRKLLIIIDNCGEIVMDKLFVEYLKDTYRDMEITAMVRGQDVLNDATREDAAQVGLDRVVKVIDNGNGIAGTWLDELSVEAINAVGNADVIISKGQGNFETLMRCGLNVYYFFLCKCDLFAGYFGVPKLTGMMINDRSMR